MMDFEECLPQILERLNDAVLSRKSERGTKLSHYSAQCYLNEKTFSEEMQMFSQLPQPILAVGDLPRPGHFLAITIHDRPLIIARDQHFNVRVFRNQCRHRGAQLLVTGSTCQGIVTCPYHAWSYNSHGAIHSFYGNHHGVENTSALNLYEVPSYLSNAFLWTHPENVSSQFHDFQRLEKELSFLSIASPCTVADFQLPGNFNWKIGVEAFLEVYHFKATHNKKLGSLPIHNVALFDFSTYLTRILVPLSLASYQSLRCVTKKCNVMYFMFPNHFLLLFDGHFGWLTVQPLTIEKCFLKYRGLTFTGEPDSTLQERIQESVEFLKDLMMEDVVIGNSIQQGLQEDDQFNLTMYEPAIQHFHKTIRDTIDTIFT